MVTNIRRARIALAVCVGAVACGGGDGGTTPPPTPTVATVVVSSGAGGTMESLGDTRQLTAVANNAAGSPIAGAAITWTTSDAAVATVAGSGASATVTATGNGTATITAASGTARGTASVQVAQKFAAVTLTAASSSLAIGASTATTLTARDARGGAMTTALGAATYTVSDRTRVMVSPTGTISAIAPGTATVTAALTVSGVNATASVPVTVTAPAIGASSAAVQATDASVFTPSTVTILEGGTVNWAFGALAHNVTFQSAGAPQNIGVTSGASATRDFTRTGTYPYTCTLHAGMSGTVNVVAGGLYALLNGAAERPTPVTTSANGAAVFTRDGNTINYVVTYQGIASNPTGMHIHAPAGLEGAAGIIVDLMPTPILGTSAVHSGSFTATAIRGIGGQPPISLDSLTSLLRNGQGYVNVHSSAFLAGEIRGQLGPPR